MVIFNLAYKFEDFILESFEAKTAEELFRILIRALEGVGYDRVIFSIVNDRDLTPEGKALGIFHNYPEDWQKYYAEKNFERIDPVIKFGAMASRPFRWDDLINKMKLSQKQINFFNQGEEAGLYNGVAIPIRGSRAQLSGIALASSEKVDACDRRLDLINAYCQQFFLCYKRMFAKDPVLSNISGELLSPKEGEILTWVANGKTDEEIAIILSISRHTVDTHIRHIFQKLDVTNRIQAVVKAIMMGMINP
ncbi:MAG: LuxR family transcriptional regulator [Alphaproteobacteria bacterium]|nr:LuxR family transcriptional regulator [Alphaproteobacteria bacterium]